VSYRTCESVIAVVCSRRSSYAVGGNRAQQKTTGFTIVELLIVIVVIGILAAITIVSYNGVQNKAKTVVVQSALSQAVQKLAIYAAQSSDQYPTVLADADIKAGSNGLTYQYTSDNTISPRVFCVTATTGSISYYVSNKNDGLKEGICPGHNLLVWDKTQGSASAPILSAVIDTATYRTTTSSMRIGPGYATHTLRGSPYSGSEGQSYTVSFWMLTDSNWNGTNSWSKVRITNAQNNNYVTACGYQGAKTTWTYFTCTYVMTAAIPQIGITVGNDGTVGAIWIDDLSLTLSE